MNYNWIAILLIGAVVGISVGYVFATDDEARQEDLVKLKNGLNKMKKKYRNR